MTKRDRASAAFGCGCGSSDHLLHSIRHRGAFHRLCTSCVLRFHLGSFCPLCFQLFDRSPPSDSIKCSKCPSICHSSCVRQETTTSYLCPSCINPNSLVFDACTDKESVCSAIDLKSAKALVAAAQLASLSMSRAAAAAKVEAERKVRESAFARKRAREALERVALVLSRGKELQEVVTSVAEEKKASRGSGGGTPVTPQKRIHNRKLGGGTKTSALSNLGIQQTGKLVGMQGKEGLGGSASVSGHHNFQKVDQREKLGDSSPRQFHDMKGAMEKKQMLSGPSLPGSPQHQCLQGRHVIADDGEKAKGVVDSGLGPAQLLSSNKDAMASKTNPGAIFMGSAKAASLIS